MDVMSERVLSLRWVSGRGGGTQIAKFMGLTWGPPGSCRPQMGPCWPHEPCHQGIATPLGWWIRVCRTRVTGGGRRERFQALTTSHGLGITVNGNCFLVTWKWLGNSQSPSQMINSCRVVNTFLLPTVYKTLEGRSAICIYIFYSLLPLIYQTSDMSFNVIVKRPRDMPFWNAPAVTRALRDFSRSRLPFQIINQQNVIRNYWEPMTLRWKHF